MQQETQISINVQGLVNDPKMQAVLLALSGGADQISGKVSSNDAVLNLADQQKKEVVKKPTPAATVKKIEKDPPVELDEFGDPILDTAADGDEMDPVPTLGRLKELAKQHGPKHKAAIIAKLKELDSDSVTNLAEENYAALAKFFKTLK